MISCSKILVTAGPTYEPIDPVRFIGNRSSGKMGFAIAEVLADKGIEVVLVTGPVLIQISHPLIQLIRVETADEMAKAVFREFASCDGAIMASAVADYTPVVKSKVKIKKSSEEFFELKLKKTVDILASLGKMKNDRQKVAGFSLETDNEIENTRKKMETKNADMIVLNSLQDEGAGFSFDTNKVTIFLKEGKVYHFPLKPKNEVAFDIVNTFLKLFK